MAKDNLYAVLLAGGKGTRLWPLSAGNRSKSFAIIGKKHTLAEDTIARLEGLIEKKNIIIVVDKTQEALARKIAKGVPRKNILVEPFGRSTASAVGLAAIRFEEADVMAVLPTDALIKDPSKFRKIMKEAASFAAENDSLVCLGITPKEPSSAYGYIKLKSRVKGRVFSVDKFIEKPSESVAAGFMKKRNYLWNAGIFIFKAETILNAMKKHAPALYHGLMEIKNGNKTKEAVYSCLKNVSIDYQVIEKAKNIFCVKSDFSWHDLGGWKSLERVFRKDKDGNTLFGSATLINTRRSVVYNATQDKLGIVGMRDAIIAHTKNGTLVAGKKDAERVKELVSRL